MYGFIEKMLIFEMEFFGCGALKFGLISNQRCKLRPTIININSNNPLFSVSDINNLYA